MKSDNKNMDLPKQTQKVTGLSCCIWFIDLDRVWDVLHKNEENRCLLATKLSKTEDCLKMVGPTKSGEAIFKKKMK